MNIAYTQLHTYILELVLHTYIHIYLLNERKFIKPKQKRYAFSKHIHQVFRVCFLFFVPKNTHNFTHTTNQRNRRFYNSLLSSFPFPGSSCAASTQQRVQGTTPRIDEPLVPSPNLNEMNVEELEIKRARERYQTLAVDYFPPVSK